jgi:hypothetical protein
MDQAAEQYPQILVSRAKPKQCAAILSVAFALAFSAAPGFAQRSAAGGTHSGGGFHSSGGMGGRVGGGQASTASSSVSTSSHGLGASSSMFRFSRAESPSAGSGPQRGIAVSGSSGAAANAAAGPPGLPERVSGSRETSSSEPVTYPRNVTIGFPPRSSHDLNFSAGTVRRGGIVISGQNNDLWAEAPHDGIRAHVVTRDRSGSAAALRRTTLREALVNGLPQAQSLEFTKDARIQSDSRVPGRHRIAPGPPSTFWPRHRRHNPPIFGGFGFFGSGFGAPSFGLGLVPDCDPLWGGLAAVGCDTFGYWNGYGAGFGLGYDEDYDTSGEGQPEDEQEMDQSSQEPNPSGYEPASERSENEGQEQAAQPLTVVFLKSGTSFAVTDYWLAGDKLHYVTSYGGENAIGMDDLDLQKTVDANAGRGIAFVLKPAPAPGPSNLPQPQDQ